MEETPDQPTVTALPHDERLGQAILAVVTDNPQERPFANFIDEVVGELGKSAPANGDSTT